MKKRLVITKEKNLPHDEFMAAGVGDTKWLNYSLRDGHDPCLFDKRGLSSIHIAAMHGRLECLKLLVETYFVDVNFQSQTGFYPLHLAINKSNDKRALECVKYLISKGADVNCVTKENTTALHKAASQGMEKCVKYLLDQGAESNKQDTRLKTAHDLARVWGKKNCARIVQNKVWNDKQWTDAQHQQKVKKMRNEFKLIQLQALHQLLNEQDFFGSVSFNNWMEDKGFKGRYNSVQSFTSIKSSEGLMSGLISRLFASGTLKDIANRLEKLLQAFVRAAELKALESPQKSNMLVSAPKVMHEHIPIGIYSRCKDQAEKFEYIQTPNGLKRVIRWNYSTNLNSNPVTDIRFENTISLSTKSDVDEGFPGMSNISYEIIKRKKMIVLKLINATGAEEVVKVPVNVISPDYIEAAICGNLLPIGKKSRMVKLPEFQLIHIYDIQRKRPPTSFPMNEMVLHLKMVLDGYLFGCRSSDW